jgi:ATP-dependent RNA helicase RhlE
MPFQALGLEPRIVKAIQQAGYTEPTPIQIRAVPEVLRRHDVVGIAQTGTGKTAAFVWPMLQLLASGGSQRRAPRALIVEPTRELVVQIEQNIRKYGEHLHLRYATVYGGVGEQPQIAALRRGVDILVATPGRLLDLAGSGHVDFSHVQIVVLDEADRMLDMGFLPAIRQVMARLPRQRQTLLFSATLSREIEKTAAEFLNHPKFVEVARRATPAETVTQFVYLVNHEDKVALLLHVLRDKSLDSVLVFARTRHGADKLARKLTQAGVVTATLHSNRSQAQRLEALRRFKSGHVRVLVATDIASRGIDVLGISHVINFDFPPQPEDYVHRIGRTGRAQAVGDALSFVTPADLPALKALERFIGRGIPRRVPEGFRPLPRREIVASRHQPRTDTRESQRNRQRSRSWPQSESGGSHGASPFRRERLRRGRPKRRHK